MSDFASLLGQFQQSAQTLATSNPKSSSSSTDLSPPRKRARQVTASDFPPVKKIFILCPAGVQTGGPEALHQLCHELNSSTNIAAYMVYVVVNSNHSRSSGTSSKQVEFAARAKTPLPYRDYEAPAISYNPLLQQHRGGKNNTHLILWPECWTDEMLEYLDDPSDDDTATATTATTPTPCAIWWLSVNNNTGKFKAWDRKDIVHLYQSEYAKQHLKRNGATHIFPMTEYISNPPILPHDDRDDDDDDEPSIKSSTKDATTVIRDLQVVYNPAKGVHYTDEIRKRCSHAKNMMTPIGNGPDGRDRISPSQVRALLKRAKIYIDFGPHPGMDRLPREAALSGCLVVTNKQGAAQYHEDVPLPPKYKISTFDPDGIVKLLKDLLENFEERSKDLDEYRAWIRQQPEQMKECVKNLVEELVTKRAANVI